jgi:hypothetical protein
MDVKIHVFLTSVLVEGEWSASCTGRFTPGGKSPQYPSDTSLGGLQNWPGRYREVKILDSTGTKTLISQSSSPSPVVIPTELLQLL